MVAYRVPQGASGCLPEPRDGDLDATSRPNLISASLLHVDRDIETVGFEHGG